MSRDHWGSSSATQERENEGIAQGHASAGRKRKMDWGGIYNEKSQDWVTDWLLEPQKDRDAEDFQVLSWKMCEWFSKTESMEGEQVNIKCSRKSKMIDNYD